TSRVIGIHNPDGSLASRHELENALVPGGQAALGRLLLPGSFTSNWIIALGLTAADGFTFGTTPSIQQTTCFNFQQYCNTSLAVQSGAGGSQVILQGTSSPIGTPLTLNMVYSGLVTCNSATPTNCAKWPFTSATTNLRSGQVWTQHGGKLVGSGSVGPGGIPRMQRFADLS
ncbi:MAG TPA: hypothetical protein VK686_00965, partial [Bryobacteraceae bacterium]|nr:hypothetical protein [Bryobacteraceae bacterium]